jgi:hypothetical protein
MCAEWRALRAQQQKNWALHNLDTMFGSLIATFPSIQSRSIK